MFAAIVGQSWAAADHPFSLEINGVDRILAVDYPTINLEMGGPGTNGSMSFTLSDPDSSIAVAEWDEIRFIEHAATRPILFGGFVQSARYLGWASSGRSIVVRCVGYGVLLDKKVVPSFEMTADNFAIGENVVSLVNRHGGVLTALTPADWNDRPDATSSVVAFFPWYFPNPPLSVADPSSLRAALQTVLNTGAWANGTGAPPPTNGSLWVDSARRVMCLPDVAQQDFYVPSDGDYRFSDAIPGIELDTAGTYTLEQVEQEREDIDRITSAYVEGTGSGIGWFRAPGLERAGDLEAIVVNSAASTPEDVATYGGSEVGRTTAATVRGSAALQANGPLDVWPGRHITVDDPQTDLTPDLDWRISGVSISFDDSTSRRYTVAFGGNRAQPSAMNRTGRFATR